MIPYFPYLEAPYQTKVSSSTMCTSRGREINQFGNNLSSPFPVNSCCNECFFYKTQNMYLNFLSFLKSDMVQVVEILPCGRQKTVHPGWFILWLLLIYWCKEPGHQQPWYRPSSPEYSGFNTRRVDVSIHQAHLLTLTYLFVVIMQLGRRKQASSGVCLKNSITLMPGIT